MSAAGRPTLSHGAEGAAREVTPPGDIAVRASPGKGRGVFALRAFRKDELVEVAPVLVLPPPEKDRLDETVLASYVFAWGETLAIALGFGSLYNHSWTPNLEYRKRFAEGVIEFVAIADIPAGSELTTNYTASNPHAAGLWADLE